VFFRDDFVGLLDTHARIASKISRELARHLGARMRDMALASGAYQHLYDGRRPRQPCGGGGPSRLRSRRLGLDHRRHLPAAVLLPEDPLAGGALPAGADRLLLPVSVDAVADLSRHEPRCGGELRHPRLSRAAVHRRRRLTPWVAAHLAGWQDIVSGYINGGMQLLDRSLRALESHWPTLAKAQLADTAQIRLTQAAGSIADHLEPVAIGIMAWTPSLMLAPFPGLLLPARRPPLQRFLGRRRAQRLF
jgi:hypothetical protein